MISVVGNGFFTMKHKFKGVREQLNRIYSEFDSFSIFSLVFDDIDRLNVAFFETFYTFNHDQPSRRLERKEQDLINELLMRYQLSVLQKQSSKTEVPQDGLPATRVLIGPVRTEAEVNVMSSDKETLYKLNNDDNKKQNCLHMTFEHCDKSSSIRFARTYFLTTIAKDEDYLKGCSFTTDTELGKPDP
jgi:hypothetical protein